MTLGDVMEDKLNDDKRYIRHVDEIESENDPESDEVDSTSVSSEETDLNEQNEILNTGWVDSISKILKIKKPKGKKTVVLSKAKKLTDVKRNKPKPIGFEVETPAGRIKEEIIDDIISNTSVSEPPSKKKREIPNVRIKPNILGRDNERILQKIATKGVVQLFNAVKMQQKEISEKLKDAGPLEAKKEKALKNLDKKAFLDVLMGEKSQNVEDYIHKEKMEKAKDTDNNSTWSVLKDDFMMTAKMKDWDKELEVDELSID